MNTASYILLALLVSSLIISLHQVLMRCVEDRSLGGGKNSYPAGHKREGLFGH